MLQSLFILSSESGEVLFEKHWGTVNERSVVCDFFWNEFQKAGDILEVPSVLVAPQHYLFHYSGDGIILLSCTKDEMPPLLALEWMKRVSDVFVDYFGDSKEATLRANFVTVYQLLEEMMDCGIPLTSETNMLKEMIAPPNIISKLASSIAGTKGVLVSNQLPEGVQSNVPWRSVGIKYASNEIFFDLTESVDACVDADGKVLRAGIVGTLECNARLSGMPDITLTFENSNIMGDVRLHPCVRFNRFTSDRVLSFVPPDGAFKLMDYRAKMQMGMGGNGKQYGDGGLAVKSNAEAPSIPIYVKPQITYSEGSGRVSIMVGPKGEVGENAENIVVNFPLPHYVVNADLTANHGTVQVNLGKHMCVWDIGRLPKDKTPILSGMLRLEREKLEAGCRRLDVLPILKVDFKLNTCLSGLNIDALTILNEQYKPYKGVKTITLSENFEIRT